MAEAAESIRYTVHGKVQGVFFRKHTQQKATSLGLRMSEDGWVHHIAARRRFLLARDHGLISLLD